MGRWTSWSAPKAVQNVQNVQKSTPETKVEDGFERYERSERPLRNIESGELASETAPADPVDPFASVGGEGPPVKRLLATPGLADAPAPLLPAGSADAVQGPSLPRYDAVAVEAGHGVHEGADAGSSLSAHAVQNVQKVQNPPPPQVLPVPKPTAAQRRRWAAAADRIDGVLGRYQRGDFSRRHWQQIRADVRRFVESGWAHHAWGLGWHMLELFGVDRRAPWERDDHRGLALILDDSKVIALDRRGATIETPTGARQTYTRRPVDLFDVVLVDQIAPVHRLQELRPEWADVLKRLDRCRVPRGVEMSDTRWQQYRGCLHRLAGENWDYRPIEFMDWDVVVPFSRRAKLALAWVMGGHILTNLTNDTAICGGMVFRRSPGDQSWHRDALFDQGREKTPNWLAE